LILEKAAELLARSPTGDVATRAVCEAAGVTQPVLYRLFGDKDGLLGATVDFVWDQYLSMKRATPRSADSLVDLRAGWDSHVAFALANPHAYRLLFGTSLATPPEAGAEAMRLLRVHLDRLAEQGRLRVAPDDAARLVMAANTGVALGMVLRPHEFPDPALSTMMRDLVHRAILAEDSGHADVGQAQLVAATTLRGAPATGLFTTAEAQLLDEWLQRIQTQHRTD
jgi:AcrR family transcriptional regulator